MMSHPEQRSPGSRTGPSRTDEAKRLAVLRRAVRDIPEPKRGPMTREVVETLRDAELDELADAAEELVGR